MTLALSTIVKKVYWNLSVDEDSKTYDKAITVVPKINSVYKQICRGEYRSVLQDVSIKWSDLRFLRRKTFFEWYETVYLTAEASPGDTTVQVTSSDNLPASGHIMINWSIAFYSARWGNQIAGVVGLLGRHDIGAAVHIVHRVPTDARKSFEVFSVDVDGVLRETEYIDYRYQAGRRNYYTIIGDDTASEQYVFLNYHCNIGSYWLYYIQDVPDLVLDTDVSLLPSAEFDEDMLSLIVSGELLRETEAQDTAQTQLQLWYTKLIDFYNNYRIQNKDFKQTLKRKRPNNRFYFTRTGY